VGELSFEIVEGRDAGRVAPLGAAVVLAA